jgi:hypothetical protein
LRLVSMFLGHGACLYGVRLFFFYGRKNSRL